MTDISLSNNDFHDKARLLILDELTEIMDAKDMTKSKRKKNKSSKQAAEDL